LGIELNFTTLSFFFIGDFEMNTERILESWEDSAQVPILPNYLKEVISLSFNKSTETIFADEVEEYLRMKIEQFKPILATSPFNKVDDLYDQAYWCREDHLSILRNLTFIFWFQEEQIADISQDREFTFWKEEAFVSAMSSFVLAKSLFMENIQDIFILTFLKDLSELILAQTFPKIYQEMMKLPLAQRIDSRECFKVTGTNPGVLSAWILKRWGFPEDFCQPLVKNHVFEDTNKVVKIIYFSRFVAEFILNHEENIKFKDLEKLFKTLFNRGSHELLELLVEVIRILPKQAAFFGFQRMADLTIIEILKEHINLFDKDLLTYNDLLNETVKAHKRIISQSKEIQLLRQQLERNIVKDVVTGLYNHTYFREFLVQKMREAIRYEYPLTLILFDLDNFNDFNREFGYEVGNDLMYQVAEIVRLNIRQSDILARIGGDEFALVLPYTGIPHSRIVAEKIHRLIENSSFSDPRNTKIHKMTVSLGYASILPDGSLTQDDTLISKVTKAMNKSKKNGGNSITQVES
jgi:diguanylate cyclase (GGDEF)-like protein